MPRSAIEVVQANNAAFSAMDVEAMLELFAPDAEMVDQRRVSMGTFTGHDELRAYYLSIFHSAAQLRETLEVIAERDGVVAASCELWGRLSGDTAGSGLTIPYALVVEVQDGLIRRLQLAEDAEHALELSGLERT